MFHRHESAGSSAAYWESEWGVIDPADYAIQARRHCESSPIGKLVTSKVQPDRLFIDGGCGHGYWVKYLHDRGQRAAGVDFAENTLNQLRSIDPQLDLRFGDVHAMPFADGEVHVYYSGGVVEHFEDGPIPALREARRVLAPDGWFLCSVPDASPLRNRVLYRAATETRGIANGHLFVRRASRTESEAANGDSDQGARFFQYVFQETEFRELLRTAGFEVVETFGESMVWGLFEVVPIRRLYDGARLAWRALRGRRNGPPGPAPAIGASETGARPPMLSTLRALPRRILLNEDRSVPILGPAVGFVVELAANLRMYVARPSA
jgi:SAM-dependent methyltransferase